MNVFLVLIIAIVLSAILILPLGRRGPGPWRGFLFFLALFFFGVWALGVWITPVGPPIGGVYFVPFFIVAAVLALLILAVVPRAPDTGLREREPPATRAAAQTVDLTLTIVFWILMLCLIGLILARHIF
jgi:hypothetical protein